ncbi:MAG: carbamate kinase [Anaerococcus vaginalis]|uniref:carbamate kinase n=1 Tax=Anaerococcus jeddahensis TaxID=1673719 RepID=UPI0006725F1E|nr:carbamate kinase [Anaerococcus jeddahensis]KWZ99611.1 carbamate kinase [Anaerococcus hydrogenalis]MDU2829677.1 carbamate kinase [Anaerococcus sp.]MDU5914285.1 carbamate kinase [Anaerococcus vaginalis]
MTKKRLVIALGGNALGNTPEEQLELVKKTAKTIVDLSENYDVAVGHGNGPQVGMINNAMEFSANNGGNTPEMPFPECGAMSQGYIGYHLSQSIRNELKKRGKDSEIACVVTQVLVDKDDEAFNKPTKPIGSFLTKEEAEAKAKENGYEYVEDAGRGYRRVVASPIPKEIVEINVVENLVSNGNIVITVGGGGVPVINTEEGLQGVPAVIDKDRSSALLAKELNADMLVILTAVDRVMINFNKPNQEEIKEMTIDQAKQYIEEGHFAPGSMLPKVEACLEFVENSDQGQALITSLEKAAEALEGKTGTIIKK